METGAGVRLAGYGKEFRGGGAGGGGGYAGESGTGDGAEETTI